VLRHLQCVLVLASAILHSQIPHPLYFVSLQISCGLCFTLTILITKIIPFVAAFHKPCWACTSPLRACWQLLVVMYKLVLASAMHHLQIPHALYFMSPPVCRHLWKLLGSSSALYDLYPFYPHNAFKKINTEAIKRVEF
jgi:hypothetical protein